MHWNGGGRIGVIAFFHAMAVMSMPCAHAGLDVFTTLDEFDEWIIERKVVSQSNELICRASMPKYGSWFAARVRLDSKDQLLIPSGTPNSYELSSELKKKLKNALGKCRTSLIYALGD